MRSIKTTKKGVLLLVAMHESFNPHSRCALSFRHQTKIRASNQHSIHNLASNQRAQKQGVGWAGVKRKI